MKGEWKKRISSALALLLSLVMIGQTALPAYAEADAGTTAQTAAAETTEEDPTTAASTTAAETTGQDEDVTEETLEVTDADEQTYIPEDGLLADNDELVKGYLLAELGLSDEAATVGNYGESTLTGLNKTLYNLLKTKVAAVAEATSSTSTVFEFSASELGLTTGKYYTAEDLGVSSLGTVTDGKATLADGVSSALLEKIGATYDQSKIMDLLLVNCPYELYWYDKKTGAKMGYQLSYGISSSSSGTITEVAVSSYSMTVSLAVASSYQDSTSASTSTYIMSGSTSATVQTAKKNAQSIVTNAVGESDYTKLKTYKEEICSYVSYNDDAASNSYNGGYGDPWQLIYVFDGDDTTEVVCEGYSKAFQYLCDLSDFDSDEVCCYTVTGTMSGGTGEGAHMWNIVTMGDGGNYLVDVTNCDSGTVGADDKLFLVGTSGSITDGYSFTFSSSSSTTSTVEYKYKSETTDLYGTGSDSILNLASSNYSQANNCAVLGHSLSLSGDIGVNFYIYLTNTIKTSTTAYVQFTVDDKTSEVMVSEAAGTNAVTQDVDGYTGYRFQCPVNSTQMAQKVKMELYDGESTSPLLTNTYAVNQYSYDSKDTKLAEMIQAMLNYGAYAQTYFGVDTDNLAKTPETMTSLSANTLKDYAVNSEKNPGSDDGAAVRCCGASLVLDSTTSIYFYIDADSLTGYTVTVDDTAVTPVEKSPSDDSRQLGSTYYVKAENIAADDLDETYTLKITDSSGSTVVEIGYSAYSYIYSKLNSSDTSDKLKNLVTALYYYGEAASAYKTSATNG